MLSFVSPAEGLLSHRGKAVFPCNSAAFPTHPAEGNAREKQAEVDCAPDTGKHIDRCFSGERTAVRLSAVGVQNFIRFNIALIPITIGIERSETIVTGAVFATQPPNQDSLQKIRSSQFMALRPATTRSSKTQNSPTHP